MTARDPIEAATAAGLETYGSQTNLLVNEEALAASNLAAIAAYLRARADLVVSGQRNMKDQWEAEILRRHAAEVERGGEREGDAR